MSHQVVPSASGRFVVDWSFTSDVPLDGIVIGLINWKTKNKIEVGSQTKLKAKATWADHRTINAP
ncbi:MAG: hypothetical protein ACREBE_17885 [bacterium]